MDNISRNADIRSVGNSSNMFHSVATPGFRMIEVANLHDAKSSVMAELNTFAIKSDY